MDSENFLEDGLLAVRSNNGSSNLFSLFSREGGMCTTLHKANTLDKIAKYIAENNPLSYEGRPGVITGLCSQCENKCFRSGSYSPLTQSEIQKLIDTTFQIMEGDGDEAMDAVLAEMEA
jgi:hypothetical protein